MTDLCGALALAYVIDPRPELVDKLRETLAHWPTFYRASASSGSATAVRWRQSAMIQSIIALDVMHDALAPADLASLEAMLDPMILQWWTNIAQDGTESTPGVVTVWALYKGDAQLTAAASDMYLDRLFGALAPSGVYDAGSGYAWVRQGGDRISKYAPVDILQFTGTDTTLYSDPRLRTLHEWMYSGSFTPRRTNLTFGDTDPSRRIEAQLGYMQPYRANRFSAQAARNAAWVVRDVSPKPLLSNFVLWSEPVATPQPPASTVWKDCATFWEEGASTDSLMGALWNPRSASSHSHRDVNAVHLYAYGENVLRNSGYCGSGEGIDLNFDWSWVNDTAASSNTVTIDSREHDEKFGAGILEGLTASRFDYAAGASGRALDNGSHVRSLLMVHGEPGRPGYFVLLDEVDADDARAEVNVSLHPDSERYTTLAPRREYEWSIQHFGNVDVALTVFLGTKPTSAEVLDGGLCAFDGKEYVGKYLRSTYLTDDAGRENVVTLAVPHAAGAPRPSLTRIVVGDSSGAHVGFSGGVDDFVLESKGIDPVVVGSSFFLGKAIHCRKIGSATEQYFVRAGRGFDDGGTLRVGFDSDASVTLFVRHREAHVTSSGATVTFFDPALTGNRFSSPVGVARSAGPGFVEVALNPGVHAFDLHTGAVLP
ncbi:MAG TPA: heparinase II/III family protein [Planctomycetota bacterium]